MKSNKTFFIIKPEIIKNNKIFELFRFITKNGFSISYLKAIKPTEEIIREHYSHLVDKPFFNDLLNYMSNDVIIGILEKDNALEEWRILMGATDPNEAEDNTIRKVFGYTENGNFYNAVHGSDNYDSFVKEVKIWYSKETEWIEKILLEK